MSQRFDFAIDVRRFSQELEDLGRRAPAIMARAVNRGGTAGKTAVVRAVAGDTGIQQKNIERELRVDKANSAFPRFSIEILGRRIPLIAFQARGPEPSRGKGRGVSYRLPTGRGRIADAFIATMPAGHRGVFRRVAKRRLPIIELFGPSIPHVFEKFIPLFGQVAMDSFAKNLAHEISFAKSKEAA